VLPHSEVDGNGFCSQIWNDCDPGAAAPVKMTSSNFDYGLRFGRSFRPTWTADGRVLHSGLTVSEVTGGTSMVQLSRLDTRRVVTQTPQLQEIGSAPTNFAASATKLLEVHLQHSVQSGVVDQCPVYELPRALGAQGGTERSYQALCKALDAYVKQSEQGHVPPTFSTGDPEVDLIGHRAFSLLSALYGQEEDAFARKDLLPLQDVHAMDNNPASWTAAHRRREGFVKWLRDSCRNDMEHHVKSCQNRNDGAGAVVAALAGGDFNRAVEIATEEGWLRLAALLSVACFHPEATDLVEQQKILWAESGLLYKMPVGMQRLYQLLGGDLDLERSMCEETSTPYDLDWRRCLSLQMWTSDKRTTLKDAVTEYDDEAQAGSVPFPVPRYAAAANPLLDQLEGQQSCVLYQLLKARAGIDDVMLKDIITPLGYNASEYNYDFAFHLASLMHALGCAPPLTTLEWTKVKDAFCAQLVTAGLWQWAVYVWLCSGANGTPEPTSVQAAKDLVLRHYTSFTSPIIRVFLADRLKVPLRWMEEALTTRAGYDGNAVAHVTGLMSLGDMDTAALATETVLIPAALLNNDGQDEAKLLKFLQLMQEQWASEQWDEEGTPGISARWKEANGCGAVLAYLELCRDARELLTCDPASRTLEIVENFVGMAHDLKEQLSLEGLSKPPPCYWACRQPAEAPHMDQAAIVQATQVLDALTRRVVLLLQTGQVISHSIGLR
jgi:hypothetical protein